MFYKVLDVDFVTRNILIDVRGDGTIIRVIAIGENQELPKLNTEFTESMQLLTDLRATIISPKSYVRNDESPELAGMWSVTKYPVNKVWNPSARTLREWFTTFNDALLFAIK